MKRCIVYLPYEMEEHGRNPRILRPMMMVEAFRNIGYDVFVIWGRCRERKKRIKELKRNIRSGLKYEFLYSESRFIPTLLTEPHHFPTHPFMDFGFFKYIKKQGIKIGLFYCDIYWKFKMFRFEASWKNLANDIFARYDILQYKKLLDRFYLPSLKMADIIGSERLKEISALLIPGSEDLSIESRDYSSRDFSSDPLHVFYVGSIHEHYQLIELIKAVASTENCILTLCCRKESWQKKRNEYEPYMNQRIRVIHKSSDELGPYYKAADIGALLYKNSEYMNMAIPYKSFEYLSHELPAVATENTAIGDFIEKNKTGWVIPYNADAASKLFTMLIKNPELIAEKRRQCAETKKENLWICRAKIVEQDLCRSHEAASDSEHERNGI